MDERRYRAAEERLFEDAGIAPTQHRLRLPTVGTTARVLDVGEGRPVVFLHGGPDAGATWSYLAAHARGLRCLLVDRLGCGLSERPPYVPDAARLPGYLVQVTVDVLDALGLERATLVGCSLGGSQALRTAAAHPDRVSGVVLAGCPPFVPGWTQPGFFGLLRTPVVGRLVLASPVTRKTPSRYLTGMGHARSLQADRIPAPMLEWVRAWLRDTDTMRNEAAMIVACGNRRDGFDPSLEQDEHVLGAIDVPCRVVIGTDDVVGGEPVARALAAALPRCDVEVMPGAGHLPWLDDPALVARSIAAFVADFSFRE